LSEFLLIFWVSTLILDEVHQFIRSSKDRDKFRSKLVKYLDNSWNYIDICGCVLFILGMLLRFLAIAITNEDVFTAARFLLAIDLAVWYIRLLHKTIIFRSLGPKLVMLSEMAMDLIFFMVIMSIFICTFGVVTQATLYPNNKLDMKLVHNIVNKAYWPIYGEMLILEELNKEDTAVCSAEGKCPLESGRWFSFVSLMVYMVVVNVLLINLLIAMFSATFKRVQEKSDQIWKFQLYRLVFEYRDTSKFPPPFNFIDFFIKLVKLIRNEKGECDNGLISSAYWILTEPNETFGNIYFLVLKRLIWL
jgi:hypothetical protein